MKKMINKACLELCRKVKGFTPVELAIVIGMGAFLAATLIFMATSPKQMAQLPPVNVNVNGNEVARTTSTFAQETCTNNGTGIIVVPTECPTIQAAVDAAVPGNKIMVQPGNYYGAWIKTNDIEIIGAGGNVNVSAGSEHNTFLIASPVGDVVSGVKISGLTITSPDNSDMRGITLENVIDVVISHNKFVNVPIIIDEYGMRNSEITYNEAIVSLGAFPWAWMINIHGGFQNNLIAFNDFTVLGECPGWAWFCQLWAGPIMSWGSAGYGGMTGNKFVHNKFSGSQPAMNLWVDDGGFIGNYIGFNDFRDSAGLAVSWDKDLFMSNNSLDFNQYPAGEDIIEYDSRELPAEASKFRPVMD
jgi:hypothetical protein